MSTVYPSGLACDTSPAATVPPAPSTFWTTIWAPSLADIGSAISRVTVSVGPPAENGTTTVMFRSGYPSAPPPAEAHPSEPPEHAVTTSETATRRTSALTAPISLAWLIRPTSLSPSARDGREIQGPVGTSLSLNGIQSVWLRSTRINRLGSRPRLQQRFAIVIGPGDGSWPRGPRLQQRYDAFLEAMVQRLLLRRRQSSR